MLPIEFLIEILARAGPIGLLAVWLWHADVKVNIHKKALGAKAPEPLPDAKAPELVPKPLPDAKTLTSLTDVKSSKPKVWGTGAKPKQKKRRTR